MKNFKLNLKSIVQSNAREKKRKEKDERVLTMKEASIQHPFSTHCNQEAIRRQSGGNQEARGYAARVWKYAAMLLMVLTLGVGQMWG